MADSLKNKTVKGVAWSGIGNIIQFGVSFVVSIILARLLSPDDYGLIGIVTIFTTICNALINAGFTSALIRKKDATENDYNTVFIVNLGASILLYTILFFCAPMISSFFNRAELTSLTRISTISMIIGALALVQGTRLTKRIDFKTQTKITFVSSIASGVVGIGMAFCGYGIWALVAQQLLAQSMRTLLLWVHNKWIPSLHFSRHSFHKLFGYGWKMMASSLLDTIWKELYVVIIGKFYSPATLGQYSRAGQFSRLFSSNLTNVIQKVTFPVLSNIQDDKSRMVSAYRRIIKTTMFVTATSLFFLGAISEPLLFCLIGPKWHEATIYLPLICIMGTTYPLSAINLNMLQVQGRSDLFLGLEVIKKIVAIGPLFIGAFVGIMPMLYTNIFACVIYFFLNSYYSGKLIGYSSWMQLRDIARSYAVAIILALSVYGFKYIPISYWVILPIQLITGSIVLYFAAQLIAQKEYKEMKDLLSPYYHQLKRRL